MSRRLIPFAAIAVLLTACSGGSIDESGAQLAKDGRQVMAWEKWVEPQITSPATENVACGDGTFKRVFTASATLPSNNPDADDTLDNAERTIGARFSEAGYETATGGPDQSDKTDSRQVKKVKQEPEISFTYTMTLAQADALAVKVEGQTACM
ncbi:hypothetical protein GCM10023194_47810 [Planotetraspora phitsanulokensis]|uniref:Lipoprotein n=1 Tax=Planotetraspora phitsanulokensis TaxID=575192 RepID=A0A8J3XJT1_9ACTN|nr:hypothetical protein [Planotetraspora phitsanulokensis]GII43505.1 hypothetical protein Pph01_85080 [Planotetraspora phitsanulokensis]